MERARTKRVWRGGLACGLLAIAALGGYIVAGMRQTRRNTDLLAAVQKGDAARVAVLLRQGADPNALSPDPRPVPRQPLHFLGWLFSRKAYGPSALDYAARGPRLDIARLLVEQGADSLEKRYDNDQTLLIMAARQGDQALTRLLLNRGADVNARDWIKATALMYAATNGDESIARLLLDHGADVNAQDSVGRTALLNAVGRSARRTDVMKVLLGRGANPHLAQMGRLTPLRAAGRWGTDFQIWLLVKAGATR